MASRAKINHSNRTAGGLATDALVHSRRINVFKLLLVCAVCAIILTACEQQKQASAEVGAIPKQIIDKATNDISKAEALAAEQLKAVENIDASTEIEK